MKKYFASHIYEEDINGIPMEILPMSPEDKWVDDRRWTTAASEAGAKKNIRAKIRKDLGYDWKEIQHVDMVFGPVKKETYLGLYNMPVVAVENKNTNKEENDMENAVANLVGTFEHEDFYNFKEERIMNKKEMVKNSNAVLMQIIDKRTNEEKHLFAEVFHILHASDCYIDRSIDKPDTHVLLLHDEEGVLVTIASAIEFGRKIYTEISQLVDETNTKAIRQRLAALFGANKKEETPVKVTQEINPYEGLAQEKAEKPQVLTFDLDLEYQKPGDIPRNFHVTRKISVLHEGNFYHGYVYHSNGQYLGHWYWNVKYLRPIFTSNQDVGDGNKDRYEVAIRKALKTIGVYCIYMPESADRKSKAI